LRIWSNRLDLSHRKPFKMSPTTQQMTSTRNYLGFSIFGDGSGSSNGGNR
jgi:hypothetical protein